MSRFSSFFRLTRTEKFLFLRTVCLLAMIGFALRLLGFKRVQNWLGVKPHSKKVAETGALSPLDAQRVGQIVAAAAQHGFYRATCLPRSLVLQRMLERFGYDSELRIGVRKSPLGKLEAHAWVEIDGRPLIDGDDVATKYAAFDESITPLGVSAS
ncbi:MAG: lasso peptide biosynthesis B2 protein [Planctomycetes bacterium]|nr:lasso peptide biosynthesis B2 protein [Planctomycetota bacterium]